MPERAHVSVPARWIAAAALATAALAVWVTLRADFLAYPGWLALQKADFILGPVFVGLYWLRRRPASHFGPLLIAFGFAAGVPYILHSSSDPVLFSIGVLTEAVIFMLSLALVLAFPTGRLSGRPERLLLTAGVVTVCVPFVVIALSSPVLVPAGTISGCRAACPENGLMIEPNAALAKEMVRIARAGVLTIALGTVALIVWRLVTGTPPRRRAFIIGAPIAVFFLLTLAAVRGMLLFEVDAPWLADLLGWGLVISRALIWYGFLIALIAAELFAGRVLRGLVMQSLRRPPVGELEAMLREPLGDPGLRLAFPSVGADGWVDALGAEIAVPDPASGRVLTQVERDGRAAAAIVHDAQLAEEPELLRAAGAVALLAQENAELEAAWNSSLRELRDSRRRIVAASESERRKLERDLHDGAQQRLVGLRLHLALASEQAVADPASVGARLTVFGGELDEAIQELRDLAHGIFPSLLAEHGLVPALQAVGRRGPRDITVIAGRVGRYPPEIESAVYYCCLEALQNATKHAGPAAHITARLSADHRELRLEVSDDGPGFDVGATHAGVGLRNMEDRLGAVHGRLVIASSRSGTRVSGVVPIDGVI